MSLQRLQTASSSLCERIDLAWWLWRNIDMWIDQSTLSVTVKCHCNHCHSSELCQDWIKCHCFHQNKMNFSQSWMQILRRSDWRCWTVNMQLTDSENRKELNSLSAESCWLWNSWWNLKKLQSSILKIEEHWTSWLLNSPKKFSCSRAQALSAVHRCHKTWQWVCSSCRHDCSGNVTS